MDGVMSGTICRRGFLAAATAGIIMSGRCIYGRGAAAALRVRREIGSLSAGELTTLRDAFRLLQNTTGVHGYQTLGGYHGEPDHYCHRDSTIFLPWHRAYIFRFEEALRKINPSVTLPF